MYKRLKVLLLAVLVLSAVLSFASCDKDNTVQDDPNSITLFAEQSTRYSVIYPYGAENEVVNAALTLANTVEDVTGAFPSCTSDRNISYTEDAYEILIGETDREIPGTLLPDGPLGYIIAVYENSVIILGGTDTATVNAVEYFCENIVKDPTIIERDFIYRYTHLYTDVTVNEAKPDSFTLSELEGVDTKLVALSLSKATGLECNTENSNTKVSFALDYELNTNTVRVAENNGGILISASSKIGLTKIDEVIQEGFSYYESIDLSDGGYIDLNYPIVDVTELPESYEKYFTCTTDKPPMEYGLNEEMVFTLTLKCDGEAISSPGFFYTVDFDGGRKQEHGNVSGENGSFEIRTSLDKPGFVKIYAAATSEKTVELRGVSPFNGGAGAAVNEIVQGVPEPEDFDEFWQSELAKLDEIEPIMTVKKDISEDYPGYIVKDIRIECVDGPVSGYLSIPENAAPGSLGILVGFTGYGVISPEPTVREDRIVFTVNAHSLDNGREQGYYSEVANTILYSYGFNNYENSNRDTVYFKNMILRDVQAIRYLKTLEEWDGQSITLNGGSQGAYQAVAVAALDPDITYLFGAYTWLCDLGGIKINRISGWRPDYTDALCYFDAVNFAKRITCETRIDAGLGDYTSPPSGVTAMINAMNAPVTYNITQGMTHFYTPPEAETYTIYK